MTVPFIGSEATASGALTRHVLRRDFVALHRDVYLRRGVAVTATRKARAAWLRSRRRGILAGHSAAALHGAKWIDAGLPATIIDCNRRPTTGVNAWNVGVEEDEIVVVSGMRVTNPARTALDLARRYPVDEAMPVLDSLARATRLDMADVDRLVDRYRGRHGVNDARSVLGLVDCGAESPRETWLRMVFSRWDFPRPTTQIPVYNEFGVLIAELDMGWEDVMVAAEYEGDHHRSDPDEFYKGIRRHEDVTELGWIDVRATKRDTEASIVRRVAAAFESRGRRIPLR